jgi:nucleoside-diphosphate kinase
MLQTTFALVKSHAYKDYRRILEISYPHGLLVMWCRHITIDDDHEVFEQLYTEHAGKAYYEDLLGSVSGCVFAMSLSGENAIAVWRDLMGPTDPRRARAERPSSIRARFGGDAMPFNAVHGSDSLESAARELELFWPELVETARANS